MFSKHSEMMKQLNGFFSYISLWQEFLPQKIVREMPKGAIAGKDLHKYIEWPVRDKGNLKLGTIWFDEIVLQLPDDNPSFILETVERGAQLSRDTIQELERIWVPIRKYVPDYLFLGSMPAWESRHSGVVEIAERITIEETRESHPEADELGLAHEVAWAGAGLIDTVNLWFSLNDKSPCCFIPNFREKRVLEELFEADTKLETFEIFSEFMQGKLPTLSNASWNKIVELRHSEFIHRFRQKLYEVQKCIFEGEVKAVGELVEEMLRSDLKALAKSFQPAPFSTLIKGIASNWPLPIPVNPISAISSIQQIYKEYDIHKRYGWIYFMFEIENLKEKG